ncbi:MAG: 16S rRNA (guanine(966)-N(2))-methyltransferase RsmD [Candidatus Omnitrophica bacterium]|nr:16S rRNA (guanine(966)-N(2))-methyltransferase RsmD [Candidatus Omnitrophota bacterium]
MRITAPGSIRPTKDNVKEALFNVLAADIRDARVLELFAGCGAIGIEALSRGASYVCLVDSLRASTSSIRKNLERLDPEDIKKADVFTRDVISAIRLFGKRQERFDIIFLDPPYYRNWLKKCLKNINIYDILSNSGLIVAEHSKKDKAPENPEDLLLVRQLTYGDTILSIYKRRDTEKLG